MNNAGKIKCPECGTVQKEEIDDLVEVGDMEGSFPHWCDKCRALFCIEFEYRPIVKTRKSGE